MRTIRRAAPGACTPVPSFVSPSPSVSTAATAQARPPVSPGSRRPISGALAPRSPLPGVNRLSASSRLVFPAPFGPCSTTVPAAMDRVAAA